MPDKTDNHGLNKLMDGEQNWEHSSYMQMIKERLQSLYLKANRSNYTPHAEATFIATVTDAVYDGGEPTGVPPYGRTKRSV